MPQQFTAQFTRYGRGALFALAAIVLAGFLVRAWVVVNPLDEPGDDALAYRALAEALYEDGTFGYEKGSTNGPEFKTPSDWSPGAPLIYAASYYATGGVRDGVARGVEALLGTASILLAFLLTARLLGPPRAPGPSGSKFSVGEAEDLNPDGPNPGFPAGTGHRRAAGPLFAAALVAFYPPFIHSTGALMSEPPAIFVLPLSLLLFLWADGRTRAEGAGAWARTWPWILPGVGFGLLALIRPEYLAVCAAFGLLLLVRAWIAGGIARALGSAAIFALAVLVPIVPWTIHNYHQLDRVVPISTGSGKALFTGTYYPGDGEYQRVKAELYLQQTGNRLDPGSSELEEVDPVPLFDRVAEEYKVENGLPDLDRDGALGRLGRENFERYLGDDPVGYAAMTIRKTWRMWSSGVGEAMSSPLGRVLQVLLVLGGLAGLVLLALRRRWEAIAIALPVLTVTAVASLTLAPPRRNEILMTLVLSLAGVALDAALNRTTDPDPENP